MFQFANNMLKFFVGLLLSLSSTPPAEVVAKGTLVLEVQNIKTGDGMIWVGVYASASDFLIKEKATLVGIKVDSKKQMTIEIPNLEYGEYALAVFHDENNNGEMDRNLVGIPSEPFAFSKPPVSKFRIPTFEEVKFTFEPQKVKLTTKLKKWWQS